MKMIPAAAPTTGPNHRPNPVRPILALNVAMNTADASTSAPITTWAQFTSGA